MKLLVVPALAGCALFSLSLSTVDGHARDKHVPQDKPKPAQDQAAAMAKMMAKAKKYTTPGKHHQVLNRFIGSWKTQARIIMGGQSTPPESGTVECSWLMPGRWMRMEGKSQFMGKPMHTFALFGYDNFKQSYVTTSVSSMDTGMLRTEGDMDPGGKVLITYGTIDEYLTGEHDKMVKSVWRFLSPDKIVWEVHDLPIGEKNTKVMEFTFTRDR